MFSIDKNKPKTVSDFRFNYEIIDQLIHISTCENIPHIIMSGPKGSGKKTLANFFLQKIYDESINNLTKKKYNVAGSSSKKEITILHSDYHIVIEPTGINHDKYILQEIIKEYAIHKPFDIFKSSRKFKTILIHDIEKLAINSQAALRRTMELFANTCRFIMICNDLTKIIDPLKSRCRLFCVPRPTEKDLCPLISELSLIEHIRLDRKDMDDIISEKNNGIKSCLWTFEFKKRNSQLDNPYPNKRIISIAYDEIIKLIISCRDNDNIATILRTGIRELVYDILITNVSGSEIIIGIMDKIIRIIDDDEINKIIVNAASMAETNMNYGRRDVIHIDAFIAVIIREIVMKNPKIINE